MSVRNIRFAHEDSSMIYRVIERLKPHDISIFFHRGFAIHGTNDISRLGGRASHGCVRLHPSHAAALFALVKRDGPRSTRIEISN